MPTSRGMAAEVADRSFPKTLVTGEPEQNTHSGLQPVTGDPDAEKGRYTNITMYRP